MRTSLNAFIILVCIAADLLPASGQVKTKLNLLQLFKDKKMTVYNREAKIETNSGRNCIVMNETRGEGVAWLNGISFTTGTIEIDLRGQDVDQHSFLGIAFHGSDDSTYDAIYFRPFNFRSADTVRKKHAVQYVSHPVYTWRKLRDEYNGIYEKAVNPIPDPNDWFHAKIVVTKNEVLVYVDDDTAPSLRVTLISKRESGTIGLWTGDGSGGRFANLIIQND